MNPRKVTSHAQRGYVRPRGAACDIGAFELQIGAVTVPSLSQWALIGLAVTLAGLAWVRRRATEKA